MLKKVCALFLAGAMTFAGCISVFASDSAALESEANEIAAMLDSLGEDASLDEILHALGSEEGLGDLADSLDSGEGLGGLLNAISGDGSVDLSGMLDGLGLGNLASNLTEGDGSGNLSSLLQGLGLENLSQEELAGLFAMLQDPDSVKELLAGLLGADGIGTAILDKIGGEGGALGTVVESLKGDDGAYDVDKIMDSIENVEEKAHSVVINGTEIAEDELQNAAEKVLEFFSAAEETESIAS